MKTLMLKATRQPKSTKALAAPAYPVLTSKSYLTRLVLAAALALQLLAGLAFLAPTGVHAELAPPQVAAPAAIAVDVASGRIIYGKNIHKQAPMASTTKIMTVLTAFSIPGVSLGETYKVVKDDLVGEASIPLSEGEVISFQDLLWGTLMNSGNDGATAIARYAGAKIPGAGDPVAKFVARMNTYASQLGMKDSHYTNPHGLDQDGHYSTPFDLAISGWYLLKNPTLKQIVGTQTATVAGHALNNLNNPYLKANPGANGIKPGYTDNAGLVLVGSATRDSTTVITVVMGEETEGYRSDPTNLLNYSFAQLKDPTYIQKIQQGASAATAADYLGRPEGDKLTVFYGVDSSVLNAQLGQTTTPGPTAGAGSGSDGSDPNAKKSGVNVFTILLIVLILLGLIYVVLRFTPLGGERGRQFAYALEDGAAKALYGLRKFWTYLKPGSNDDEDETPKRPKQTPALSSPPDLKTRLGQNMPPRNVSTPSGRKTTPLGDTASYRQGTLGENQRVFGSGEVHKLDLNSQDAVSPFGHHENEPAFDTDNSDDFDTPAYTDTDSGFQPPRPLSNRPTERPVERPTERPAEPTVKPLSDTPPFKASTVSQPIQPTQPRVKPLSQPTNPPLSQTTRPNPTANPPSDTGYTNSGFGAGTTSGTGSSSDIFGGSDLSTGGRSGAFGSNSGATGSSSGFGATSGATGSQGGFGATSDATGSGNSGLGSNKPPFSGSTPSGSKPAEPIGGSRSSSGAGANNGGFARNTPSPESTETMMLHARQAIDYAYAGRLVASTDEFKRVVERDPLFDFAMVEEFEHMPVTGYKALATAYRDSGKANIAVLLLEMAVETFPNELELRNMLKYMRRDMEQ